jgi:hypothetical protein
VPAFDPQLGTEIRETFADPNWNQWIKLHLELTKFDGSLLKMEMLRAEDWVLEQIDYQFLDEEDLQATAPSTAANSSRFLNALPLEAPSVPLRPLFEELHEVRWLMSETEAAAVLVTIALDLPEIGVRGEAVVTGVEPCPVILPGPGKVVLTTFHHASSDLIDLYLSPQPPTGSLAAQQTAVDALLYPQVSRVSVVDQAWERIGVTGNHPIWSEDRHDYVAAMDLRVGERLKNLSGDTVWVQQKLPRPGPTPVYNLEVQDEHVYYVGASGVLAHNMGNKPCETSLDRAKKKSLPPRSPEEVERSIADGRILYRNELIQGEAADLGFITRIPPQRAPFNSHGQDVFSDGKHFITIDIDSHIGGRWKKFDRKGRRLGTYNERLERIGD